MTVRWKVWLVVLCAAVVFLSTSVEATHFHNDAFTNAPLSKPFSKKTNDVCLLCNSVHSTLPSATVTIVAREIHFANEAVPAAPNNPTRLVDFVLLVRPPPTLA
jgi:hypothetical protein